MIDEDAPNITSLRGPTASNHLRSNLGYGRSAAPVHGMRASPTHG
ncbi:hypothetical protein [Crateriforma conspicua]|nr:hypothetical protein [Crateriforma conspicua]